MSPAPQVTRTRSSSRASAASGSARDPGRAIKGDDADAVPRVIARLEERAAALTQMLDEVGTRAEQVRQSTAGVDAIEARIAALEGNAASRGPASEDVQRSRNSGSAPRRSRNWSRAEGTLERLDGQLDDPPSARCCRSMRAPISRR